jgi:O-antigen/teichoic acid export membrane protein
VTVLAPGLFVAAILIVPVHSLGVTLAEYVGAWLGAAGVGTIRLVRVTTATGSNQAVGDSLSYRSLVRVGMPVLGANLAASLAQFGDRILVSFSVPIRIFALYGFASSVMVAASAGVHALSRVSLSHAARHAGERRAVFLGELYDFLGVGFGIALAGIPLFEHLVAWWLPAFVPALLIVRALVIGAPIWAAIHVVVVGTLQTYGLVRRQFAVELGSAALVAIASWRRHRRARTALGRAAAASGLQ